MKTLLKIMPKQYKKNKSHNKDQSSFYFEDYLETNKKNRFKKKNNFQDRIYIFFFFFINTDL